MAFTEGFEYDIFIGYTHADNFAPEGKKGWVDDFHEEPEASLVRRFGYNKIAIWRDKNPGKEDFSPVPFFFHKI